jgi:hypothetical protein
MTNPQDQPVPRDLPKAESVPREPLRANVAAELQDGKQIFMAIKDRRFFRTT